MPSWRGVPRVRWPEAGVAGSAWWHERGAAEAFGRAESRLAAARGRYTALTGERREWRRATPLFREWQSLGRIGEARPARWAEGAGLAASGVLAANHRLGQPRNAEPEGPVVVWVTDMSVDFEMRHEGELPEFFRALERDAGSLFTVSGCRLVRAREIGTRGPPGSAIDASCRIRWQTIVLSGAEPGWSPPELSSPAAPGQRTEDGAVAESRPDPDGRDDAGSDSSRLGSVPPGPSRETFGRLFTTPAERARIEAEAARAADVPDTAGPAQAVDGPPAVVAPPPARWIHVNGVLVRSGKPITGWIDGRRVAYEQSSPERRTTAGGLPPRVRLHAGPPAPAAGDSRRTGYTPPVVHVDTGGRRLAARPGQRLDLVTGAVIGVGRRQTTPRSERGEFLRTSSHLPLTEAPAPGLH